ncbi:hypothetical protein D9611_000431 [Ephemerocybe angulata]|uniref:Transmembrane protein n=1 Tax=Ephemerocybe angulata TaxID=980116 RepID=A0A8H5BN81_9AGAR|nr:hypothetical protein D9611_000431 [Tulosesus angulatus]
MPDMKFRIEDTSPLLSFEGKWSEGSSLDPLLDKYSESAFMLTNTTGSAVSFTFYGTEVELFGAMRGNHGRFSAQVDGAPAGTFDGRSEVNDGLFQRSLFKQSGLGDSQHTVRLANVENGTFLDVDFVTWVTQIGENDKPSRMITVQQDDEEYFQYSGEWTVPTTSPMETFFGGSGRATGNPTASLKLTFESALASSRRLFYSSSLYTGDAISLFGPVGPQSASRYGVRLNNGNMLQYSATRKSHWPQQMLYHASGLTGKQHTLEVVFLGNAGEELAVDFANIYTNAKPKGGLSGGVVFGLAFTSAIALMSIIALILIGLQCRFGWFPWLGIVTTSNRSKRTRSKGRSRDRYHNIFGPRAQGLPLDPGPISPFNFAPAPASSISSPQDYSQEVEVTDQSPSSEFYARTHGASWGPNFGGQPAPNTMSTPYPRSARDITDRPQMSAIDDRRPSTTSSVIANSWVLRNVGGDGVAGASWAADRKG